MPTSVVIGGTNGIGRHLAEQFARRGDAVVIAGRNGARAKQLARQIGRQHVRGIGIDLALPATIPPALQSVTNIDNLVITALDQVPVKLDQLDIRSAIRLTTIKLVGYAEVVRVLAPRMAPTGSIVLFGGQAKDRPYDGSTMLTTVNAGVSGLIRTLAREIAPRRINAIHPGVVGDSPKWRDRPDHPAIRRTPIGRLVTMDEVAHAVTFLLENTGANAINLPLDGGWLIT